jgi:hypothetical protein
MQAKVEKFEASARASIQRAADKVRTLRPAACRAAVRASP